MMKTKLNSIVPKFLWMFFFVLALSLFSITAMAQLASDTPARDSTSGKIPHLKRVEFLAMSIADQNSFLNAPPFIIDDLINCNASDLMTATPGVVFMSAFKFYKLLSPADEYTVLHRPDMYKVYE